MTSNRLTFYGGGAIVIGLIFALFGVIPLALLFGIPGGALFIYGIIRGV